MKRSQFIGWLVTLSVTLLMIQPVSADQEREIFEKTYTFRPGGRLLLSNTNGGVSIDSWDKEQVKVVAEKIVKARSRREAERFMKEVHIIVDHRETEIKIEAEYPRGHGRDSFWDFIFGGGRPQVEIRYHITVPEQIDLDIETTNGGIRVEEVTGRIQVRTTNGGLKVFEVGGTVTGQTTNGAIETEILKFEETDTIKLATTNGAIKIYLPRNVRADLRAGTVNGSISTDFPLEVQGKFTSRKLRGSINGGGGQIELSTTNGSIRILER